MTKEQLIDVIVDKVNGGDGVADGMGHQHPAVIEKHIELAFNSIIYQLCLTAISNADFAQLDAFVKAFNNVSVTCDTARDEYYSTLPVAIINLPVNRGVRMICPMKDQHNAFVFRENNTCEIYDELEVGQIDNRIKYYLENTHIFYNKQMTDELATNGVLMKIIPTFSGWGDTDELPLPGGKDMEIIEAITQSLMGKPQQDQIADNSERLKVSK